MSRLEITDLTARKCPRENERKQKQHFFFSFAEMTLFMVFLLKLFGSYLVGIMLCFLIMGFTKEHSLKS